MLETYIASGGGVLQVPTGGHATNLDHWFPVEELSEQIDSHLQWREKQSQSSGGVGWLAGSDLGISSDAAI